MPIIDINVCARDEKAVVLFNMKIKYQQGGATNCSLYGNECVKKTSQETSQKLSQICVTFFGHPAF